MHTVETFTGPAIAEPSLEPSPPIFEVDIDAIHTRPTATVKRWHLTYDCDGAEFVWHGPGKQLAGADLLARRELADKCAGFDRFGARLVATEQLP